MKTKKLLSGILALIMIFSMSINAFALTESSGVYESGGSESVPVTLNVAPAIFSVTVPSVLPVSVTADGEVVCAESGEARIINYSHGAVKVTNLEIDAINGWETVDFDNANMHKVPLNSRLFAFTINDEKTTGADAITFDTANFPVLDGANDTNSDELVINYDALVAPQNAAVVDMDIANIIFTIGWEINIFASLPEAGKTAEEYTWEEIGLIIDAGKAEEYFDIGDTKTVTTSDGEEIIMEIIAFNTDDKADGSGKATITWISKYNLGLHAMTNTGNNEGGWENSYMRSWLRETIYPSFPTELQNIIVPVTKAYARSGGASGPGYITNTCTDTLWIPSSGEVFGSREANSIRYSYFEDAANRHRAYNYTYSWWLRTAYSTANFYTVTSNGEYSNSNGDYEYIVVLGFCT